MGTLTNNSQSPNYPVEGALIDDFTVRESFVDLTVDDKKALMISSESQKVKFFMHIKNQGNYISSPSTTNYYISSDTILDGSDYYLGEANIEKIRPDMYFYVNKSFDAPSNLSDYKYLIYDLDVTDINSESIETNNIGYWRLALDSIDNYPYFNDFNDSIINGWHQYSIGPNNPGISKHRFRNMIAPGEPLAQTALESGEWFTDRFSHGSWNWIHTPYLYLESPEFDFSGVDSIFLSFDLMCTGRTSLFNKDGGNFQFSTDGGNTWTILTSSYGQSYNWHNFPYLSDLDGEPGWSGSSPGYGLASLDSTSFDISFLKGEEHVVFKFKYRSNNDAYGSGYSAQGMRLDDFRIDGLVVDYIANDTMGSINSQISQPDFTANYSISNNGQIEGRVTTTKFFWSNDSIFDSNDILIDSITENPIISGDTYNSSVNISYPMPITQTEYYLFYITDADSNIVESDEVNNLGSFKITFSSFNYFSNIEWDTVNTVVSDPSFDITYSIINNDMSDGLNSTTAFYWSDDNIFDLGDQNIHTIIETPILSDDTLLSTVSITYPTPVNQDVYYLFFRADDNDDITETNEGDNTGVFTVIFDSVNSISDNSPLDNIEMYVYENQLYVKIPSELTNSSFKMKMINSIGQDVYNSNVNIYLGLNIFPLPNNLSTGIYLIHLQNGETALTMKILRQN
jgi:hypothetical protein